MLSLDPQVIGWLAMIANLIVQLVKGLIPETGKRWVPLSLVLVLSAIGLGLAAYTGRDLVAGLVEGFLGACSSMGLYELASSLPGVDRVWTSDGWIKTSK